MNTLKVKHRDAKRSAPEIECAVMYPHIWHESGAFPANSQMIDDVLASVTGVHDPGHAVRIWALVLRTLQHERLQKLWETHLCDSEPAVYWSWPLRKAFAEQVRLISHLLILIPGGRISALGTHSSTMRLFCISFSPLDGRCNTKKPPASHRLISARYSTSMPSPTFGDLYTQVLLASPNKCLRRSCYGQH